MRKLILFVLLFAAVQIEASPIVSQIAGEIEDNQDEGPIYKQYTDCPLWYKKTHLKDTSRNWIKSYSRMQDSKGTPYAIMDYSYTIYNILMLNEKSQKELHIEREEQLVWLAILGDMILKKWNCDNLEDEKFKQTLGNAYSDIIKAYSYDELLRMVAWAIENKSDLKYNWLGEQASEDYHIRWAYDNLMANVIYTTLDLLKSKGLQNSKAAELAMRATFDKFDGTETVFDFAGKDCDFRAIGILLKWTDHKPVIDLIKKRFNPSDSKNLRNNLWIIQTLSNYGLNEVARDLTLMGDDKIPSILLKTAVNSYASYRYDTQAELRPLIRLIQSFVFE